MKRIWAREYANGVHFSETKKDGYTAYVQEKFAVAMFLRAQLELLGVELEVNFFEPEETERPRPRRATTKSKRKRKT